jgi:phage tail-like protein
MDANGLCFWMLADEPQWFCGGDPPGCRYDRARRVLRLAEGRRDLGEDLRRAHPAGVPGLNAAAEARLGRVPQTLDAFGTRAYWDPALLTVMATGAFGDDAPAIASGAPLPGAGAASTPLDRPPIAIYKPPAGETPTDMAVGVDGVLYLAVGGRVVLVDCRQRWEPVALQTNGFSAWRLAADPAGGVWILDRGRRRMARIRGLPLTRPFIPVEGGDVFQPCEPNPDPPRLLVDPDDVCPGGEDAIAIACSPGGRLAVMTWDAAGEARLRCLRGRTGWDAPRRLEGARYPYSLAWISEDRIAVLVVGLNDAPVFPVDERTDGARALGDLYLLKDDEPGPLGDFDVGPFIHGLGFPTHYPRRSGCAPLHRISLPAFAASGEAANFPLTASPAAMTPIDGGSAQTVWHRLYLEAAIPDACGVTVWLAATDAPEPPATGGNGVWHEHRFGRRLDARDGVPRAAWVSAPSELPFHHGLLPCRGEKDRAGLFTALIQRPACRVRALRGQYLWVRVILTGDGRSSPEVAALRAYASRFSYVDRYLPALYRETVFGDDADAPGPLRVEIDAGEPAGQWLAGLAARDGRVAVPESLRDVFARRAEPLPDGATALAAREGQDWIIEDAAGARRYVARRESRALRVYQPGCSPADFLGRFLNLFEGVLTPLEDRIAAADLLTDPRTVPEDALEWLGSWIGMTFEPGIPGPRRRQLLRAAPILYQRRGTLRGLNDALNVATGGTVLDGRAVGGVVDRGEAVVVEDFRLRRTFATLLGVDLTDEKDPLVCGLAESGNSIVGDTLFLGDETRKEFLALFGAQTPKSAAERVAVAAFFERLAHRVTVLVHRELEAREVAMIRRVVEIEAPAHVLARVVPARYPFIVAVASLVGIDTRPADPAGPRTIRLERSFLGTRDVLRKPPSLDPRLEGDRS